MASIVCSREAAMFIPSRETIVYHRLLGNPPVPQVTFVPLSEITRKAGRLEDLAKRVLSRLLSGLKELSLSFRSIDLEVECDPEVTPWEYVEIRVEVEAGQRVFKKVSGLLVDYSYAGMSGEEAAKVLLVLSRV
jgi:hypothetical protein